MSNPSNRHELLISKARRPLGEILIEAGLIDASQLEFALQTQASSNLRIGEILASHNWIKQQTADFFAENWHQLLDQPQKKPLIYYFRQAGLLNEQQIAILIYEQQQQTKPTRFHRLAVKKRYIKQITVDFFLANIFNIYNNNNVFSFAKPYEILSRYNKGEINFRRSQLIKAPLVGVSLKGIYLDGSNLREANLSSSNLSDSSLIQSNLYSVNLVKAILTKVNFKRANLSQADLREAHLAEANFTKANLQQADLRDAHLMNTVFAGTDLRDAKLPTEYSYDVFYDSKTAFDPQFEPQQAGWKKLD